jgi:hypothetical protein
MEIMMIGLSKPMDMVKTDGINELVKAALPGMSDFIDSHKDVGAYYLTDQLQSLVLESLRKAIDGVGADEDAVARSHRIMELARKAEEARLAASAVSRREEG